MRAPATRAVSPGRIALWASLVSIVALSIDMMLPALEAIGRDLDVDDSGRLGLVVLVLFAGFALGQIIVGPLSDALGRRPVVLGGLAVFIVGSALAAFAPGFGSLLLGRLLQGLAAAGPRVVVMAIARDCLSGRELARTLSIVMAVFILAPVIGPAIGQALVAIGGWRSIFAALGLAALVMAVAFARGQEETLPPPARRPVSVRGVVRDTLRVLRTSASCRPVLALSLMFAPFAAYLGSAPHLFRDFYGIEDSFALWFAIAALAVAIASLANSRLVDRFGLLSLVKSAFAVMAGGATVFAGITVLSSGPPPFAVFMAWLVITLGCIGFLFGNLNALALDPVGDIAGVAAAVVGSVSTALALPVSWLIIAAVERSVLPLALAFALGGAIALGLLALPAGRAGEHGPATAATEPRTTTHRDTSRAR